MLNVLADRPELVTPRHVEQVLKNNKNGAKIAWLNTIKVLGRLIFGRMFCKKQVIDDWEREQAENHS